jgi:hypothetical protein
MSLLHPANHADIEPIYYDEKMPEFCCPKDWVESICELIEERADMEDDGGLRIPPLGLVRCSRGGKSRGMYEIGGNLKKNNQAVDQEEEHKVVIHISFNDHTPLDSNEQLDPVEALCRRICFWFLESRTDRKTYGHEFGKLKESKVNSTAVLEHIGSRPCILLIDELNNCIDTKPLAEFLKNNFLARKGRFFVFTSHVLSTEVYLRRYLDPESLSQRAVTILKLPTIESIQEAQEKIYQQLTVLNVIACGFSPGIIHTALRRGLDIPIDLERTAFNDTQVRELCQTFVDGECTLVHDPFLQYMDADGGRVLWIPFHMARILTFICYWSVGTCNSGVLLYCEAIASAFNEFYNDKPGSGKGWEGLFYAALLIRIVAQEYHPFLNFPLTKELKRSYTLKLDDFDDTDVSTIKETKKYIEAMPKDRKNHISVYKPSAPSFEMYDIFLVVWDNNKKRSITGYQLKQGYRVPKKNALESEVDKSFCIRGKATKVDLEPLRGWWRPSQRNINSFFGVSGVNWTPEAWEKLSTGGLSNPLPVAKE